MPTHKRRTVETALLAKGFRRRDTHHAFLHYYTEAGEKTPVWTKTSHGRPGADIDRRLVSRMARHASSPPTSSAILWSARCHAEPTSDGWASQA